MALLSIFVPGTAQIVQGRRDVGLFFLGWLVGLLGIGLVICVEQLPSPFWGLWAMACGFLWLSHFLDLKRYATWALKLEQRQLPPVS